MNQKKFNLRHEKNIDVLQSNKTDQICPFMAPIPVKTSFGVTMAPQACNSTCPHFNIEQGQKNTVVSLSCSGIIVTHQLEAAEQTPTLKLN